MGAAAMALANPKRTLKYHLCALLREEMLALARQVFESIRFRAKRKQLTTFSDLYLKAKARIWP